ncbi:ATP-binding protein [Lactobacillus sp. ESL0681]|uniref:VirB4 family type IV secretion system protein n=1 Tax=Lactobacillus sp. ESL0681 TaxID=2983211 RepID=UPI0023F77D44|nr:ATP-binding protein [Lactobacillus sp. ESL0681]WEV41273.1 ATP-binding protein [Lactobacillus sp. ESL0681]
MALTIKNTQKDKKKLSHKLSIKLNPRKTVPERQIRQANKQGYDLRFLAETQPQGGITFDDNRVITADGYSACLSVIHYPNEPLILWGTQLGLNRDTMTTIDVKTNTSYSVKKKIDRSIAELYDRKYNARKATDIYSADQEIGELQKYATSLTSGGEIPKQIISRIFVYAPTIERLEQQIANLSKKLRGYGYKVSVYMFMQDKQYKSMTTPITEQERDLAATPEQDMPAYVLGGGSPFSAQALKDPRGGWLGQTSTNGPFFFDQFRSTNSRRSFNMMVLGKMGAGKSTLLKMIIENSIARNMFFRGIDKTKEYIPLIKHYGGTVVNLDGSDGMINPLQVEATAIEPNTGKVDELTSFYHHVSKVDVIFRLLNPDAFSEIEMEELDSLLRAFYISYGLLDKSFQANPQKIHITGLDPNKYPTFSDFFEFVKGLTTPEYYRDNNFTPDRIRTYEKLSIALSSMINNYGHIFDGHSSMRDLTNTSLVLFDTSSISNMSKNIYQAQLYTALSLIWNHALINGRKQNALLEQGKISADDARYFNVVLDECHNIINFENLFAVDYIKDFEREMRKFKAGVIFATQSPEEMVPDNVETAQLSNLKIVFELCQYKAMLAMDPSQLRKIKLLMGSSLNENDYKSIPDLKRGHAIISMGGQERYRLTILPNQRQLKLYAGGQ